ncbi:MAG: hypothetical protein KIS92_00635 [Planctomycetota bacterium]|nr:hypothetical protein [Planctomycetota bacterium]
MEGVYFTLVVSIGAVIGSLGVLEKKLKRGYLFLACGLLGICLSAYILLWTWNIGSKLSHLREQGVARVQIGAREIKDPQEIQAITTLLEAAKGFHPSHEHYAPPIAVIVYDKKGEKVLEFEAARLPRSGGTLLVFGRNLTFRCEGLAEWAELNQAFIP